MAKHSTGVNPKPGERLSENLSSVIVEDAPRSTQFKIVVGGIILLVAIVLITVVTDFVTTGEIMRR
ncbi:hypothetical protein JYU04_03265 [Dehalococcoides mccartyi]|nr:hypothetical protein [Dehalococcoides mccartyi]